jgi:SOS-response transcriptional repressor LexA
MSVATTQLAHVSILALGVPGGPLVSAGVLLEDPSEDRLYIRLRSDWEQIAPEEAEALIDLERDLQEKAVEMGAAGLLRFLEDSLSNTLTVSDRREVAVEDFSRALSRLYREHVQSTVRPFITHVPRYSLAVAAGKFLENQEVTEEGWEEVPAGVKASPGMFAAKISGRSMEPVIQDGSLCVFRSGVSGSRQGRLVLVEALGRGGNDRYTIKRYHSQKAELPDGSWTHERIRLEPLNPEFEPWDLDPEEDGYRIIAEYVAALD